jgi:hypothetical protein
MYYWVFTTLYTFLTIIIGQIVIEQNLRIIFYLTMLLLFVSLNNVYYSMNYYIKLRNHKGVKGDRGDPGDPGQDGNDGVCIMAKNCGIANCRKMIVDELEKKFVNYKKINEKINSNLKLNNNETEIKKTMDKYINILLPQCENYDITNGEGITGFVNIINNTIE